eukprot:5507332-Pyramimonas_sp.AAC.1
MLAGSQGASAGLAVVRAVVRLGPPVSRAFSGLGPSSDGRDWARLNSFRIAYRPEVLLKRPCRRNHSN